MEQQQERDILADVRLQFNIQHPTLEDCWLDGYEQAQANIAEDSNPYPQESPESQQWINGWWAGFYGEEPLFDLEGHVNPKFEQVSAPVPELELPLQAANEDVWKTTRRKLWIKRTAEIAGVLFLTAIAYEVADMVA